MTRDDGAKIDDALSYESICGNMGPLIAAHDWSSIPLGPIETWPSSLRTSLSTCLGSRLVCAVLWGPEQYLIYNDAYAQVLADRHPEALGHPILEVFTEIADVLAPQLSQVHLTGRGFVADNQMLMLQRHGRNAETHWSYSFAPIYNDDGSVAGILNTATETTARVMAERAQRRAEARLADATVAAGLSADFQALFEASPTPFLVVAPPDWTIVAANDARLKVTGTRREDQIGRRLFDVFPDDPADPTADGVRNLTASLNRVVATRATDVMAVQRYSVRRPDGRFDERWWSPVNTPVLDRDENVALIIHRVEDVTELMRLKGEVDATDQLARDQQAVIDRLSVSEKALRASEEFNRRILASSPDCIKVLGLDTRLEFMSEGAMCGMEVDDFGDVQGKCWPEFWSGDEHSMALEAVKAAKHGGTGRFQGAAPTMKGSPRWWDVIVTPINGDDGQPQKLLSISRDITTAKLAELRLSELNQTLEDQVAERTAALSQSQQRFQAIFDSAFQFMALLKSDGTVLEVNQTALQWSEIEHSDIVGKPFWLAAPMREDPDLQAAIKAAIHRAAAGETVRAEHQMRGASDTRATVDFSLKPVLDEGGEVVWLVAEGRDISDLKEAQEALRQSQKLEAMGQLTGGVAHDVNNLLSPIVGSLDFLQRKGLGGDREQRLIAGALESAERVRILVQRLLAFARRQPLRPTAVDVGALVAGMSELIASTSGPQTKVTVDLTADLPAAMADRNQLEMAILNLAVNARDAMPAGGRLMISARTERVASGDSIGLPAGQYIRLSVADTGSGMDGETLKRAIEPFYSTKGIGRGTGLGLSMVHGLAAQLGGTLLIDSKPDLGTKVELWLPATAKQSPQPEAAAPLQAREKAGRVLLVEDEELVRVSTAEMLIDLGYGVAEADSAAEALRLIDGGQSFDLLITDHLMPGMTGTELARQLLCNNPNLRVLLVSGFAEVDGVAPDLPRLIKPFRQADLASKLASLADG